MADLRPEAEIRADAAKCTETYGSDLDYPVVRLVADIDALLVDRVELSERRKLSTMSALRPEVEIRADLAAPIVSQVHRRGSFAPLKRLAADVGLLLADRAELQAEVERLTAMNEHSISEGVAAVSRFKRAEADLDAAVALAEAAEAASAERVESMCHWRQDRGDARAQSHDAFHFGHTCPYEAMAAVLRGEPDPRETRAPRASADPAGRTARHPGYLSGDQEMVIPRVPTGPGPGSTPTEQPERYCRNCGALQRYHEYGTGPARDCIGWEGKPRRVAGGDNR